MLETAHERISFSWVLQHPSGPGFYGNSSQQAACQLEGSRQARQAGREGLGSKRKAEVVGVGGTSWEAGGAPRAGPQPLSPDNMSRVCLGHKCLSFVILEIPDLKLLFTSPPTPTSPDSHFKYSLTPASCTSGATDFFLEPRGGKEQGHLTFCFAYDLLIINSKKKFPGLMPFLPTT